MHANAELIDRFYQAFARRDAATMAVCYAPAARFHDPVFGWLQGEDIGAMWQMLCARARDFSLQHAEIAADDRSGSACWEARYRFAATGRAVHNRIRASFRFEDGLIVEHVDQFDLWRWSRQALGPIGWLLGWSPMLQKRLQRQALAGLAAWQAARLS